MSTTTLAPRMDLARKLLAHALDPACHEGEAQNAATKFVVVCRRDRITLDHLRTALAGPARVEYVRDARPAACNIIMPFGRFAGYSLADIAEQQPSYLDWALENLTNTEPALLRAIRTVAQFYGIIPSAGRAA